VLLTSTPLRLLKPVLKVVTVPAGWGCQLDSGVCDARAELLALALALGEPVGLVLAVTVAAVALAVTLAGVADALVEGLPVRLDVGDGMAAGRVTLTARTRWLNWSATYSVPPGAAGSTATPRGLEKSAAVPRPSA
jgi:hypothetical protein